MYLVRSKKNMLFYFSVTRLCTARLRPAVCAAVRSGVNCEMSSFLVITLSTWSARIGAAALHSPARERRFGLASSVNQM